VRDCYGLELRTNLQPKDYPHSLLFSPLSSLRERYSTYSNAKLVFLRRGRVYYTVLKPYHPFSVLFPFYSPHMSVYVPLTAPLDIWVLGIYPLTLRSETFQSFTYFGHA